MLQRFAAVVALFLYTQGLIAQPKAPRFDKVEPADFAPTSYLGDSSAAAVVLADVGKAFLVVENALGSTYSEGPRAELSLRLIRQRRLRVLKRAGLDQYGVASIDYVAKDGRQRVYNLDATVYKLQNGKVIKSPLKKTAIQEEIIGDVKRIKIIFPDLAIGDIIEYQYTLQSKSISDIDRWYFQSDIPTLYSSFVLDAQNQSYQVGIVGTQALAYSKLKSPTNPNWVLTDIPALPTNEEYAPTLADFAEQIHWQFEFVLGNNLEKEPLEERWKFLANRVLATIIEPFLNANSGDMKEMYSLALQDAKLPPTTHATDPAAIAACHTYLRKRFHVEFVGVDFQNSVRALQRTNHVASATLNTILLGMLRAGGHPNAHPVLISARGNGAVLQNIPEYSQFNHVLVSIGQPNGSRQLLDASDPELPIEVLPQYALSQVGLLLVENAARFIPVQGALSTVRFRTILNCQTDSLAFNAAYDGYAGRDARIWWRNKPEVGDLFPKAHMELRVGAVLAQDTAVSTKPFQLKLEAKGVNQWLVQAGSERVAQIAMTVPVIPLFLDGKRKYPVQISYPSRLISGTELVPPTGWKVAEAPQDLLFRTPDGNFRFTRKAILTASGKLLLDITWECRAVTITTADDYAALYQFSQRVERALNEAIRLVKQ